MSFASRSRIVTTLTVVLITTATSSLLPGPLLAQDAPGAFTPLEEGQTVTISSVSEIVGDGEVAFSPGEAADRMTIALDGSMPMTGGAVCLGCMERVVLAPDLRVPIEPFFIEQPMFEDTGLVTSQIQFNATVIDSPNPIAEATEWLASGPEGATLGKDGKGFVLLEGQAEYVNLEAAAGPSVVLSIARIGEGDDALKVTVKEGQYPLTGGAMLQAGSVVHCAEAWLTLLPGLAVDVGPGGVTLAGETYVEGDRLAVDQEGNLRKEGDGHPESETTLPTYSDVVATYPPDADLCDTDGTIVGQTNDAWTFGGDSTLSLRNGRFTYHCFGAKITLEIDATWDDGMDYLSGTLLTVDANLEWVPVSSWD